MKEIRVGFIGLDDRERYGFLLAFRTHRAHRFTNEEPAELLVVDGDSMNAPDVLAGELAAARPRPTVLLTLVRHFELSDGPTLRVLKKPAATRQILSALDDLAEALVAEKPEAPARPGPEPAVAGAGAVTTRTRGPEPGRRPPPAASAPGRPPTGVARPVEVDPDANAAEDVAEERRPPPAPFVPIQRVHPPPPPPPAPSVRDKASLRQVATLMEQMAIEDGGNVITVPPRSEAERYRPADHLDGALASMISLAHAGQRPISLAAGSDSLVYDPRSRLFTSASRYAWLDELARRGVACNDLIDSSRVEARAVEETGRSSQEILWRAALLCSAGRLRQGIGRTAPCTLTYWPDLAHLDLVEGMIPVIAAVSSSSLSVEELVAAGHHRHVVNATLSALSSIEAIVIPPDVRQGWLAAPRRPPQPWGKRLFRRAPR